MPDSARSTNRLKASVVDLTFIVWAAVVPTLLRSRLLSSDGDFARHLRMGRLILRHGPWQIDDLAYTHSGPFVTTEWLSQVAFALAHRVGGLAADAVLAGLIVGLAWALIVLFMRRAGVSPLLAYATGTVAAILGAPHWVARPHLFTFLGLPVLLHVALTSRKRRIWPFALLFGVWANFHGGFILGLVILAALAAGDALEAYASTPGSDGRQRWWRTARFHAAGVIAGLAASLVNPMGVGLLGRVFNVLGNDYLMATAAEFQPMDFHSAYGRLMLIVFIAVTVVFAVRRERPSWPGLSVILLMFAGALTASRNGPLFGVVALPLFAIEADPSFGRIRNRWLDHVRQVFDDGEAVAVPGRWIPWFAIVLVFLGATGGTVGGRQIIVDSFDASRVPVAAIDTARRDGLQGRMFNELRWGGYILWSWPEQRIFIDGMTDFLGNDVLSSYIRIARLDPGWNDELDRNDISIVIMPPTSRLVNELRRTPDWRVWYADDVAIILIRDVADRRSGA
jgi:ABC-type amino acid transport system permease subunit